MIKLTLIIMFLIFVVVTAFTTYVALSSNQKPIKQLCVNEELHELTQQQELVKLTTKTDSSIVCQGVTNP